MENTMFTLRMLPTRITSVQKRKSIDKNKNIVNIVKVGLQETMVLLPWHVRKDAILQMMVISLMLLISLKILVMLISFLMEIITITFLRMSYQLASWLLQKPSYLVGEICQIQEPIADKIAITFQEQTGYLL
ncbi:Uncharacterised protein [Streptococcus pneumoniae]|uniref:Uncharacterized protein n=1 Tax=Streptococcus pneumoniae TaxID=1313 RepID=A0A4J1T020_STREE|nr:Uncharacterised protein [Streptococcus pneumoniae]CZD49321.1 Uncharacterised protein [Streptococcus pneumoniae]VIR40109.1 Uncharacterised protein [Streptococcus pneumoniae]VJA73906.1 Uncharacterised protein [Streptococcus pneumoniae]VJC70528.1 Uncharacterised protein [Streptococcus pneumoniae]